MRGRRATLKAIEGGLKKVPPMPSSVPEGMADEWSTICADLKGRGLLHASTVTVIETYVGALWVARECRKALASDGPIVRTASGNPKAHPAVGMLRNAQETIARLADELGLTPSSRSRPGIRAQEGRADADADPLAEFDL